MGKLEQTGLAFLFTAEIKKQVKVPVATLGGLAGCEAAIHLAREGKSVELAEMRTPGPSIRAITPRWISERRRILRRLPGGRSRRNNGELI